MNCFTLTSLPSSSERYFGVTQAQLIMVFNWQCVGTHSWQRPLSSLACSSSVQFCGVKHLVKVDPEGRYQCRPSPPLTTYQHRHGWARKSTGNYCSGNDRGNLLVIITSVLRGGSLIYYWKSL
jgi:hypothetical protein